MASEREAGQEGTTTTTARFILCDMSYNAAFHATGERIITRW